MQTTSFKAAASMAPVMATADLDQPAWPLDTQGFLGRIQQKSEQMENGFRAGKAAGRPETQPAGLLFVGMGFSGATADLVKDSCTRVMDPPFTIVKHYQFPRHVKKEWHV